MGEVTLDRAIELLSSEKQKDRSDGLADLKHILLQNRWSPKLASLGDKACYKILDSLFRLILFEKSTYLRAQRSNLKGPNGTRLSTCASVLRTAIEALSRSLRTRSVRAVVGHITDILLIPEGELWELLSADYIKSLVALLRYPPHVEHLGKDEWSTLMKFCLRCLDFKHGSSHDSSTRNGQRSTLNEYLDTGSVCSAAPATTPTVTVRGRSAGSQSMNEELLMCIQFLVVSPSAHIQADEEGVLRSLTEFVKSTPASGSAHQAAFHSINTVSAKALFDQSTLVRVSLVELIPVIRRLWATKHAGLKDELLVTSLFCTIILTDIVQRESPELLVDMCEGLAHTLYSEYSRRQEKDLLQLDELVFYQGNSIRPGRPVMGPRLGNAKSEHNWTVVCIVASLLQLTEEAAARLPLPKTNSETPHKKRRLMSMVEDIFRDSVLASDSKRICSLQLVPFLVRGQTGIDSKTTLLQRLTSNIVDDDVIVSSWTMLAIASIATTPDANSDSLKPYWQTVWDIASRASTAHQTSRAACVLLTIILNFGLLERSTVAEVSRSMLSSVNMNGPPTISDSSLGLWAIITRMGAQIDPSSTVNASGQISRWLEEVWRIGTVVDRIQIAQVAVFARPIDLLNLLLACTNREFSLPDYFFTGPVGIIAKSWHFCHQNQQLLGYLFHGTKAIESVNPWDVKARITIEESVKPDPSDGIILDLLQTKTKVFLKAWDTMSEVNPQHITPDIIRIICSLCIVTALYAECLPKQLSGQLADQLRTLQTHNRWLWLKICSSLESHGADSFYPVLDLICPVLSSTTHFLNPNCVISRSLLSLVSPLVEALEASQRPRSEYISSDTEGLMGPDDPLTMCGEAPDVRQSIIDINREAVLLFHDATTFQRCMTIRLSIFAKTQSSNYILSDTNAKDLVAYLISLDEADILSSQCFLPEVYRACAGLDRKLLLQILENLGTKCLQSYEMARCESSHSLCIRAMESLVVSWTNGENDHLADSASDIYTWFTDTLVTNRLASSSVCVSLVRLLDRVLGHNVNYGGQSSPSPRTCLLTIMQQGDLLVKFAAADSISRLFCRFSLKDHDVVFSDVLESLPRDPDWVEGIALRLFILAQLASQWHTLLRRSIYHIFETPAQVPHSQWYAEKCIRSVAETLGLDSPRKLFRLFSAQIVYTWMETQSVISMPFHIFGYTRLQDLLIDAQDEIIGQIIMRGEEDEMSKISRCMDTSFTELLDSSFYTAEAYSIARDISIPSERGSQQESAENRLERILGPKRFATLLGQQFPLVVATFFKSLDQYDQIERALAKRADFQGALATLRSITSRSMSTEVLPASQQPSFRSRYLLENLDFLCKRTGYELSTIWTPTLATFVCRTLLESIHPALGSFHACSVIRKIRILVSISGQSMLRDYPFEMIFYALRPFLTDMRCSEDTLGIFWYLLEAGTPYLRENPFSMADIAVSTFVSLRNIFASSSKPAEAKLAVKNFESFLDWFSESLRDYTSSALSPEMELSFKQLIRSVRRLRTARVEVANSAEHDLLVEILKDRHSTRSLLSRPVSDYVISLLCTSFKGPAESEDSVPREDEAVLAETAAIYQALENFGTGTDFRLWAAKIIGRSFTATGHINDTMLREQDSFLFSTRDSSFKSTCFSCSKVKILQILCTMLRSDNCLEVGLIERTLQLAVSSLASSPGFEYCETIIPKSLMNALIWSPYECPAFGLLKPAIRSELGVIRWDRSLSCAAWARYTALRLSVAAAEDPVIGPLRRALEDIPSLAERLLPYIIHDVLLTMGDRVEKLRRSISDAFKQALHDVDESTVPHVRLIMNCILYLRNQPRPNESTMIQRDEWLDIDYEEASSAANKCHLPKTSLLFLEIHASRVALKSRRSSATEIVASADSLHDVFKNIDDPDLFYGVQRDPSLNAVMERLEHESSGLKSLLFQSAHYDSDIQMSRDADTYGILKALNSANLQGIASSIFSTSRDLRDTSDSLDSMIQAASSLRRWDIPIPPLNGSPSATIFRAFQCLHTSRSMLEASASINEQLLSALSLLNGSRRSATAMRTAVKALSIITMISDALCNTSLDNIVQQLHEIKVNNSWLKSASFHEADEIIKYQEVLFSMIKQKGYLKSAVCISGRDAQLLEAKVIMQSLDIMRSHEIPQAPLRSVIRLTKVAGACSSLGVNVGAAAEFELAKVLWDQGEMTTAIGILQQLSGRKDLHKEDIPVSRAKLLVTLGLNIAEARLKKPEAIIHEYLSPAIEELGKTSREDDAGQVYHAFAMFCDQQLQNMDGLEDFKRVEQLRNRKEQELSALEMMMENSHGKEKETLRLFQSKTKQWFDLDNSEYQRLKQSREHFLQLCLENYLLCLNGSDAYNNDVLRFCTVWLGKSDDKSANLSVSKYINNVPSRKFAPLMSQLSSRLLDSPDHFQILLSKLILRICVDHPFHGMYQIFASSKSKGGKDQSSLSRQRAAAGLVEQLKNDGRVGETWIAVHNTNISYVRFAMDKPGEKLKSGSKALLTKLQTGERLVRDAAMQKLPPPTMRIELRHSCLYYDIPKLLRFEPEFTIASGVSAPKIVTAVASDGKRYKQLFKGGNDDLRQDAIMEQVFEQASSLLKSHQGTRRRKLGIRTYKVLPLTSNAGIIEFVPNTVPLNDYLMPAHLKYFPRDMKPNACRKHISDVQTRSFQERVRVYRQVTEHFRPVMRYFFMEKYDNPDDWLQMRLSYTRSTAAISVLGHVLGLGDRHGHNILLDERTGEVVHIDLGVAFEQGRVLPVPEVVPFRLTRDLVDGMGITKTEGVFRRCCEFTLEALRQESYSIMTILDVLRYDPLYSWTVSPLRMKRIQDHQADGGEPPVLPGEARGPINEPSEADRALTVVAKKLSKTLSVVATVNELIQQATDEKNLAVLYSGWAAYA